jgi:xanthine dehydrogenase YagS FAD-binding subunit
MNAFHFVRAGDVPSAVGAIAAQAAPSRFLAGGTNLIDLMRSGIEHPASVVDITRLPLADVTELPDGGLRIGELERPADRGRRGGV